MKHPSLIPVLFCGVCFGAVAAEGDATAAPPFPAPQWNVEILLPPASTTAPAEEPAGPGFEVVSSSATRMPREEASPLPGLPTVEGVVDVTVQVVGDPGLPDPPLPPAASEDESAVAERQQNAARLRESREFAFVSASVYSDTWTLLRVQVQGHADQPVVAWSNINFLNFTAVPGWRVHRTDGSSREVKLIMSASNAGTAATAGNTAPAGNTPVVPALPALATAGPVFVVVEGQAGSPAMNVVEQLHDLYRKEGANLEAALAARQQAEEAKRAFLLAHPPAPSNVTMRFWKRENPSNETSPE